MTESKTELRTFSELGTLERAIALSCLIFTIEKMIEIGKTDSKSMSDTLTYVLMEPIYDKEGRVVKYEI